MSTYIIDTETTGAEKDPEVIELAIGQILPAGPAGFTLEPIFEGRFKPVGRILFSAMAVHHILPAELEGCEDSVLAKAQLPTDMEYMIGHNVDYDWEALGRPACKRICTLAISRKIWPGNDGHSLSALTYQLWNGDLMHAREQLKMAHGAAADVELAFALLCAQMQQPPLAGIDSWEALWKFSEEARIPDYWTFGKHKDNPITGTDKGYLLWCLRQDFIDEYVKVACRRALGMTDGQTR